ncbi:hypothetical protein ACJMK2_005594 [Sinanodonta woodiana]|uniref:FYVE-type domain-containing protein n=1 Tax=Sinanodonta woodiana TaxID=1069815 RepID=A0ABD3VQK3_SINWO
MQKTDTSHLAQFYFADEELNSVAAELDSFDGRKDPERCTNLVNKLRACQDQVLTIIQKIMEEAIPGKRASRDYRIKFPDDVLQESLAGQLWFGAECLAAGSSIMNREVESASMRPLARALTKNLDSLRCILREQSLRNINEYSERIREALVIFDKLFAEFELSYVSAMVPVKTMKEHDMVQEITVLFSETVQRYLKLGLLSQEMIDDCDPALMFTIPRLAIVCGLIVYPEGPLNADMEPSNMSEMFRPFQTLLYKIRELMYILNAKEFSTLEKALSSTDEPDLLSSPEAHAEHFSQIDQGFDEGSQEHQSAVEYVSSLLGNDNTPILVHSPNSGSPVTPVNQMTQTLLTMSNSPSVMTIVDLGESLNELTCSEHDDMDVILNLNKSESHDSGLHSENVSTSDTVTLEAGLVNSSCDNNLDTVHNKRTSSDCSYDEREAAMSGWNGASGMDDSWISEGACLKSCCRPEIDSGVHKMCRGIVESVLDNVFESADLPGSVSNSPPPYVRHISWQYNVQFEIPRISVSNREICSQTDASGHETGSLSSDGTITSENSDTGVIENDHAHSDQSDPEIVLKLLHDLASNDHHIEDQRIPINLDRERFTQGTEEDLSLLQPRPSLCAGSRPKLKKDRASSRGSLERIHCRTGARDAYTSNIECLEQPRIQRLQYTESISSCSSYRSISSVCSECDCDKESSGLSSETSSYNSECNDDEEIALAIQAAELASRNEARSRFRNSGDLIHRLFVCISGVADQLQTNYASDLRHILKSVFDMNCSDSTKSLSVVVSHVAQDSHSSQAEEINPQAQQGPQRRHQRPNNQQRQEDPPPWVPDEQSTTCTSCRAPFTVFRRRHHCRNCGKIFCARCSANAVPLPHYGHMKPVRVCNRCVMFNVTPFTVDE